MVWKDVVGFEDYFKVSDCGQVYSKRTSKILKQNKRKNGYLTIATRIGGRDGQLYCFKVHRLVAEAFLPEPDEYLTEWAKYSHYGVVLVNHKDGDKANNHSNNLEWVTAKGNSRHAYEIGLSSRDVLKGLDHPLFPLTKDKLSMFRKTVSLAATLKG